MSDSAHLMALGFRNPVGSEKREILQSFLTMSGLAGQGLAPIALEFEHRDLTGGLSAFRKCGKICRFIQLSAGEVDRIFNNEPNTGLKAVLRSTPARIVNDGVMKMMNVLYANNGYVILCGLDSDVTTSHSGELFDSFADPVMDRCNSRPRIVPSSQHVPRPQNA